MPKIDALSAFLESAPPSFPLVWAGHGIRLSGQKAAFREFINRSGLPFVTTWLGADLIPTDHPQNLGIVGMCGQLGANKAVQDCDFLLVLGSHCSPTQTGPADTFAPRARKVIIDIDHDQLNNLTIKPDMALCADLKDFFGWVDRQSDLKMPLGVDFRPYKPLSIPPQVGGYAFNAKITQALPAGSIMVVDGGGTALYTGFQSSHIKEGSRLLCSAAMSAMGSGLPEAVGACLASGRKLTTVLIGEGSLMLNIQELQTIATHRLPIKIFVLSNGGYLAIRHTQKAFQDGRYYGVGGEDLQFPNLVNVASAFGITYAMGDRIEAALSFDGPVLCSVQCDPEQPMLRQAFKDGRGLPLDQMAVY